MTFSCTKKVLDRIKKIHPVSDEKEEPHRYNWYVDEIVVERKKYFLFTHSETLFSFFIYAGTKKEIKQLSMLFSDALKEMIVREISSSGEMINRAFPDEGTEVKFTKTNSRRILGSMNDFKFQIKVLVDHHGGLEKSHQLVHHLLNKCPMKKEGEYIRAVREMKKLLEE